MRDDEYQLRKDVDRLKSDAYDLSSNQLKLVPFEENSFLHNIGSKLDENGDYTDKGTLDGILNHFGLYEVSDSLDKAITTLRELINGLRNDLNKEWEVIYPVGCIYFTLSETFDPNTVFGGEWERLEDRFLLGAGGRYSVGETDGSKDAVVVSHTHTQKAHNHAQNSHSHGTGDSTHKKFMVTNKNIAVNGTHRSFPSTGSSAYIVYASDSGSLINEVSSTQSVTATNQSATAENNYSGVDGTDKNMPPYLAVFMWHRIK